MEAMDPSRLQVARGFAAACPRGARAPSEVQCGSVERAEGGARGAEPRGYPADAAQMRSLHLLHGTH